MKKGLWITIAVGIGLILVGVVVILMFVPLGPTLSVPTPTPIITQSILAPSTTVIPVNPLPSITATPPGSSCGSGRMLFLMVGESQPPRGTDAIRLVRVDFDRRRVDVLALPTELWVVTPGLYSRGYSTATLNQVYFQGKSLASGDDRARMLAGVNLLAATLQANFNYTPDHYFVIKQAAFSDFVNALNGVDIVLSSAVDGRAEGMRYFPAGLQHLDGTMALELVRISGSNEWDRFDRQELILQAVYQSLMTPQNWDRLPALIEAFHGNILTDLNVDQILDVGCVLDQPGVVINQSQVGPELVVFRGHNMFVGSNLGPYILQTAGR